MEIEFEVVLEANAWVRLGDKSGEILERKCMLGSKDVWHLIDESTKKIIEEDARQAWLDDRENHD